MHFLQNMCGIRSAGGCHEPLTSFGFMAALLFRCSAVQNNELICLCRERFQTVPYRIFARLVPSHKALHPVELHLRDFVLRDLRYFRFGVEERGVRHNRILTYFYAYGRIY